MVVTRIEQELNCPIAAGRVFSALILDSKSLIPKLLPQFITSIDIVQGDGDAGSVEQVNFTKGSQFNTVKHRIDELDRENFVCVYTMIEGDALGEKLESIVYKVQFEESSNGDCVCKMTSTYNALGDFKVSEEEIKAGNESTMGIYKVIETYLLENPLAYA